MRAAVTGGAGFIGSNLVDALVTARHAGYISALGWVNVHDSLPVNSCGLIQQNGQRKPDFYAFANN